MELAHCEIMIFYVVVVWQVSVEDWFGGISLMLLVYKYIKYGVFFLLITMMSLVVGLNIFVL